MIKYESEAGIARIVLDTPERSNRFTFQLMNEFIEALKTAAESGAAVLVLTATGQDFTLGRDQSEKISGVSRTESLKLILKANASLKGFPGVSIALIQGQCKGFGTGIALHSDIAIGSHDATLGFDEIKHGLAPLVVQTYLADYIGPKRAHELVVTGRDVSADEAVKIRLLNRMVPTAELHDEGHKLAAEIAGFLPGALRLMRRFREDVRHINRAEAGEIAVERLVQWIEAGKPALEDQIELTARVSV